MENYLINETSPYLLQHKNNPVNWYPWGKDAFDKAEKENKPIFLSIGYSTCHWCHVMAHESFEDMDVACELNKNFVSIKVDKEERPDIDSIYMNVCQAFTGSGGWPMSIFMTPNQKPFFAATYFPKATFIDIASSIASKWRTARTELIQSGDKIVGSLGNISNKSGRISNELIEYALNQFKGTYDEKNGGFGRAPKFPSPHNLLFLMNCYEEKGDKLALTMVEKTLLQMYKGGIFDHIGFGFSRYSTDKYFLAPHFEKMLYDNALLIICYCKAFDITKNELYKDVTTKTATYILREMTRTGGGFYSAQDADSDGVEGKYYLFDYLEIIEVLGKDIGTKFCNRYGITRSGNFDGKNIVNLLGQEICNENFDNSLSTLYEYRKSRTKLHLDDKILTSWNALMIAAFAMLYRAIGEKIYLETAENACDFIESKLCKEDMLYVSYRDGRSMTGGFLDDYAYYIYALLEMYKAGLEQKYLDRAVSLTKKTIEEFYDAQNNGFYLYGKNSEQLILKPKETYDGAAPSGNSVMAYNLVLLSQLMEDAELDNIAQKQLEFMSAHAVNYPSGHSFFLLAVSMHFNPPTKIVCAKKGEMDKVPFNCLLRIIDGDTKEYPLINNKTTYYVCKNKSCLPPTNNLEEVL